jgi:hypothetical protein
VLIVVRSAVIDFGGPPPLTPAPWAGPEA